MQNRYWSAKKHVFAPSLGKSALYITLYIILNDWEMVIWVCHVNSLAWPWNTYGTWICYVLINLFSPWCFTVTFSSQIWIWVFWELRNHPNQANPQSCSQWRDAEQKSLKVFSFFLSLLKKKKKIKSLNKPQESFLIFFFYKEMESQLFLKQGT